MSDESRESVERALARAVRAGAEQADALLVESESLDARVRGEDVDFVNQARERTLGIRALVPGEGGRGSAVTSTSDLSPEAVLRMAEETVALARATAGDPAAGLPEAGFADDRSWFEATVDHQWPDAVRRLWDAFHGAAINTPDVMFTLRDGYCVGLGAFDFFVDMASTHGGLNQANSATFVMSMTARVDRPLRTRDVLRDLEPEYHPSFRPSGK